MYKIILISLLLLVGCSPPIGRLTSEEEECTLPCIDGVCGFRFNQEICIPNRIPSIPCELECSVDSQCFNGRCVQANYEGTLCEFSDACLPNEICVHAHCTRSHLCTPGETFPCYSGPPGTAGIGECKPGFYLCDSDGVYSSDCIGELTPLEEFGLRACNGVDDNCDGITDEGLIENIDIVFAFDLSESMNNEIEATSMAIYLSSQMYDLPEVKLGLITFPLARYERGGYEVRIPLLSFSAFQNELAVFRMNQHERRRSYEEASIDIIYDLSENNISMNRREHASLVIIMFTDEKAQSYNNHDLSSMCQSLEDSNTKLFIVGDPEQEETFRCSRTTFFNLSEDPQEMANNLEDITNEICQ